MKTLWAAIPILLLALSAASCDGGHAPPEQPLSRWDELRGGKPFTGLNGPWDPRYGATFGGNAWGDAGLGKQGPSGWRFETRPPDNAVTRLVSAEQPRGNACLGVDVKLAGSSAHSAIVYYRVDEAANKPNDATIDLRGRTLTARVYVPDGAQGPAHAPSGVMLFAQDVNWNWAQMRWRNVDEPDTFQVLSVSGEDLALSSPGFDAGRVRVIGVKFGLNSSAPRFAFDGRLCIDDVSVSGHPPLGFTFDSPLTRTEAEFADMATKAQAIRIWVFADGRSGLLFAPDGSVAGLHPGFLADMDELVRIARSHGVYLMLTLFDFLVGAEPLLVDGVRTGGRADWIGDAAKRRALLQNAVRPLFDRYADEAVVLAYDVINEPEWLLADIEIPAGRRPPEIRAGGVLTTAAMRTFIAEVTKLLRDSGGRQVVTVGSASPRWLGLWEDLVEVNQVHWWNGSGQIDEGGALPPAQSIGRKPTFVGEFSASGAALCDFVVRAKGERGYIAAMPWSYRAKDAVSAPLIGAWGRC